MRELLLIVKLRKLGEVGECVTGAAVMKLRNGNNTDVRVAFVRVQA
jgi:hypothetical protein